MAEYRKALTGGLDFINSFDSRIEIAATEQARAAALRKRAGTLEQRYPGKIDSALQLATRQLMERHETAEITDEEAVLGVLLINQHKPPRVITARTPDIKQGMADFHAIEPNAPVVKRSGDDADAFVVSDEKATVSLAIARGMGGLPEANILVPAHNVNDSESEQAVVSSQVTSLELRIPSISSATIIGHTAIQQLLDSQQFNIRRHTSGFGENTNADRIHSLASAASRLVAVGHDFDTTHIGGLLHEIDSHEAYRSTFTGSRASAIRKIKRRGYAR